jgi:two-component system, OmpR family, phosphate regulon response regulator PhoB
MLTLDLPNHPTPAEIGAPKRVLVVEDEELIREMLVLALEEEGYQVVPASDGRSALTFMQNVETNNSFDLVVLDIMLPHVNGLDLCRWLRHQGNLVPILMLSAKGSETDRVLGLEVGADDYISKPFSTRELIARCRALLRRHRFNTNTSPTVLQIGDITLYVQECRVFARDEEINLSPKEFRLLELFMTNPRRVWSREQLIDRIWGVDFLGDTKTVDVHIRWLREKLEKDPSQPEYIITVRGFGYRFGRSGSV